MSAASPTATPASVAASAHNTRNRIAVATAFNLLFEYSLRGVNNLAHMPLLPVVFIATYASLFTMEEDLIRRLRLRDYHLIILAFAYGMIYECLVSGLAFQHPGALGINWGLSLFIIVVAWGGLQAVLTFYIANRIFPRDWASPPMGRRGWLLAGFVNLTMVGLFQASGKIPLGTLAGYMTMAVVSAGATVALALTTRSTRLAEPFRKRSLPDAVGLATAIVFAFCAVVLIFDPTTMGASHVNKLAVHVVFDWTALAVTVLLVFRLTTRSPIPV